MKCLGLFLIVFFVFSNANLIAQDQYLDSLKELKKQTELERNEVVKDINLRIIELKTNSMSKAQSSPLIKQLNDSLKFLKEFYVKEKLALDSNYNAYYKSKSLYYKQNYDFYSNRTWGRGLTIAGSVITGSAIIVGVLVLPITALVGDWDSFRGAWHAVAIAGGLGIPTFLLGITLNQIYKSKMKDYPVQLGFSPLNVPNHSVQLGLSAKIKL